MNLADLTKRARKFESQLTNLQLGTPIMHEIHVNPDSSIWLRRLHELDQDAHRIKQKAEMSGDDRTALAAISEMRRIAELSAKLCGRLDETTPLSILHIELDAETANRIAETYLARHRTSQPPR